jgi:hypothetical protein
MTENLQEFQTFMREIKRLERMIITPAVAREIIETCNGTNRPIAKPTVDKYVADMAAGTWQDDTTGVIGFDRAGELTDGQHRLTACVVSGRPLRIIVATQLPPESRTVTDTGKKRTIADRTILGLNMPITLAEITLAQYVYACEVSEVYKVIDSESCRIDLSETVKLYRNEIDWTLKAMPAKKILVSGMNRVEFRYALLQLFVIDARAAKLFADELMSRKHFDGKFFPLVDRCEEMAAMSASNGRKAPQYTIYPFAVESMQFHMRGEQQPTRLKGCYWSPENAAKLKRPTLCYVD